MLYFLMDIYNNLSFILTLLIVFVFNYVLGKNNLPWLRTHVHPVTDSTCGQELFLPLGFQKTLILVYDGSVFNSSCVIQIKSGDSHWNTKLCIKMDDVYNYGNGEDFRLYFGEFTSKDTSHCYVWLDLLDEVCSHHTLVHAIINASDTLVSGMKFRLKVSRSRIISKRSTTSKRSSWSSWSPSDSWSYWNGYSSRNRSPWTSWNGWSSGTRSPWSSWNSWSSWSATPSWRSYFDEYEREKEEKRKKRATVGTIILVMLGSFVVIACCIAIVAWANYRGNLTSGENRQPAQCTEPETSVHQDNRPMSSAPPEYDVVVSEENPRNRQACLGPAEGDTNGHEIHTPFLPHSAGEDHQDAEHTVESQDYLQLEGPPPSYSSLFAADKHTQHGMT